MEEVERGNDMEGFSKEVILELKNINCIVQYLVVERDPVIQLYLEL